MARCYLLSFYLFSIYCKATALACFLENVDLTGFALGTTQADSTIHCQEKCQRSEACLAFTWEQRTKKCFLKSSWYGSQLKSVGLVSGPAFCGQQDCFQPGVMFYGNRLSNARAKMKTTTPESCQEECRLSPGCKAFTWTKTTSTCHLKSKIGTNRMHHPHKISGPAYCNPEVGGICPPPACVTKWRYGGVHFQGCADPLDQGGLWCPLPNGVDPTGNWRNGSSSYAWCIAPPNCVKSWKFLGKEHRYCSSIASDGHPWCPTPEGVDNKGNFLPGGKFIYCTLDMCLDSGSCQPPEGCARKWFHGHHRQKFCSSIGSPGEPWCPRESTLGTGLQTTSTTTKLHCDKATCSRTPCGQNAAEYNKRIVGGKAAELNSWPWLGALVSPDGAFCGATLISDVTVVTAAHCIKHYKKEEMSVKLGEYDFNKKGESSDKLYAIRRIVVHPDYNPQTYEHDIALIQLQKPAIFNKSVWPICLPREEETYANYRSVVIGWGTIYYGGPVASILQEVNIRVWEQETCRRNYGMMKKNVTDNMLCAGERQKDACQGDSGGPLNCHNHATGRWELCGVVSWGIKCAEPEFPGVYTRTTKYLDWIRKNIREKERRVLFN